MRLRVPRDRHSAVIWRIQPLMPVGRPAISQSYALHQRCKTRTCIRPQAKGTIDMHPGTAGLCNGAKNLKIIACANVEVACIQDHNSLRIRGLRQRGLQHVGIDLDGGLTTQWFNAIAAQAKKAQGARYRRMMVGVGQYANGRATLKPLGFNIQSLPRKQAMARSSQRGSVRHLATRHKGIAGV